jgi:hypothetical protein
MNWFVALITGYVISKFKAKAEEIVVDDNVAGILKTILEIPDALKRFEANVMESFEKVMAEVSALRIKKVFIKFFLV